VSEFYSTEENSELTRRQWLLILGGATVAGFSGIVPELAAALSGAEEHQASALPPGLYYPSHDHLAHALDELGSMRTIAHAPGTETEYVESNSSAFHRQFFSDVELKLATRFFAILLGKVDTGALSRAVQWLDLYLYSAGGVRDAALTLDPLHRALAVAYHGEPAMRELETADPQNVVRSGLRTLQQHSVERFGREFLTLDEGEQAKLIMTIGATTPDSPLRKFFETMRTEAIRGYYTSAEGLKELDYKGNWYYALCPGCEQK